MARIRSVKPEFWLDRKVARGASRDARLLYIGLWNYADEHGRLHGDPAVIKGQVFPYDDVDVVGLLEELVALERVQAYEYDGDPYLFIPTLAKHQRLEAAKSQSRLPEPPPPSSRRSEAQSEKIVAESAPIAAEPEPIVAQQVAGGMLQVASGKEQGSPTVPALRTDGANIQQRAEPITRAYYDAVKGMCKWPAVLGIVKAALKTGHWTDQAVLEGVMRLAESERSLTVETLRVELNGFSARASPPPVNRATERTQQGLAIVRRLEAEQRGEIA